MTDERRSFVSQVKAKAARKLEAQRTGASRSWAGFGMFGVIGWSVAAPTLVGALLGRWLDAQHPTAAHSWTLMLLIAGLSIGCGSAWYWVAKEQQALREESGDKDA